MTLMHRAATQNQFTKPVEQAYFQPQTRYYWIRNEVLTFTRAYGLRAREEIITRQNGEILERHDAGPRVPWI